VNGKRVDIPSYRVKKGDVISLIERAQDHIVVRHNRDTFPRPLPGWLETDGSGFSVTVLNLPMREQIDAPVREQLIVELYSK
jgi:small subunit ribosomal protein S4